MKPLCTRVEQIKSFESEYLNLQNLAQADIFKIFKCPLPCNYKEYQIVGKQEFGKPNQTAFRFNYADGGVTEAVEDLVYTFESFVSEFGGSLSLFVGFSFFLILEPLIISLHFVRKLFSGCFFSRKSSISQEQLAEPYIMNV